GDSYILRFASGRDLVDADAKRRAAFAEVVADTLRDVRARRAVESLALFRNHGAQAGASLAEPHHQLWGIPVPSAEDQAEQQWVRRLRSCPSCALIRSGKKFTVASERTATLLARPAARFGAELFVA